MIHLIVILDGRFLAQVFNPIPGIFLPQQSFGFHSPTILYLTLINTATLVAVKAREPNHIPQMCRLRAVFFFLPV